MSDRPVAPPTSPSPSPSSVDLTPGPRVSATLVSALQERYDIVRETGRGASAVVYLARDLKHQRLVAVKTLSPDVSTTAGERFLREIQVAASMQHPYILPMYDSGVADGRLYFVMPFVDGGSLRQRLDGEKQMPIDAALRVAHDIALALQFAHDQGVVHRDIKPENILFYHGHACLADFGVARVMEELDVRVTGHGMIVGTPAYMSPEQLTDGGFDGRSDVYSLACVLYEMIAGVHAFSGTTPRELLRQRLRTPPPPLSAHRENVPQPVEELLVHALAASPDARYADARAFAEAIDGALREMARPPRRVSDPRRALETMPRNPIAWVGSLALLFGMGALAAIPLRSMLRERAANDPAALASEAKSAYASGKAALDRWDVATADRELTRAVTDNPRLVDAQLNLALALELEGRVDSDRYRLTAARLATLRSKVHGRDSLLAESAIALAGREFPRACGDFARLRAADSLDAVAWYGLGDCNGLDSIVVRDAASPSGWRFRSSWHTAALAYMRATTIDPAMHRAMPYAALANVLVTVPAQVRLGMTTERGSELYAAHPSLVGDTVAYVPYPAAELLAAKRATVPPSLTSALRTNRELLVSFAREWVAAAPKSADAYEALATGYEARGEVANDSGAAGGALKHAQSLATSPEKRLQLAAVAVRLAVKRGDFARAGALADSLIDAADRTAVYAADAQRLAGLAALTGRIDRAARYRAQANADDNASVDIPPPLTLASSKLFARAASGACDDSLIALRGEIDRLLDSYSQPTRRAAVRSALVGRAMTLSFPCLGPRALDGLGATSPLDLAQRAFAAHDVRRMRALLDSLDDVRRVARPGDISLDHTVQEAWLRAASGDTAAAIVRLDRVLNALPTLGLSAVREEGQSAAVGRALTLRAELASGVGDRAEARRRANDALVLWRHADPALAPELARLRVLAASR